jgi:hypothetical protein
MNEPWFQLPGDPVVSQVMTVLAKVGGLFVLYMIILMIIRYYVSADSVPVNAIRRIVGVAIGVPFAAGMTRIFEGHFYIPDKQFETLLFLIFIGFVSGLAAFVNPLPHKDKPHDYPLIKNN